MALTQNSVQTDTILATGALTEKTFIGYDGATCAANAKAVGVAIYDASTGDAASVAISGKLVVTAGGAVAAGDAVASDASGYAVSAASVSATVDAGATAVTSTAANGAIVTVAGGVLPVAINGYARTVASTSGDTIEVDLA